jgi:hypothetical protein
MWCGSAGAVLRGGNWNNSSNDGLFTANLNNAPSNTNNNIGFRCVFVPVRGARLEKSIATVSMRTEMLRGGGWS